MQTKGGKPSRGDLSPAWASSSRDHTSDRQARTPAHLATGETLITVGRNQILGDEGGLPDTAETEETGNAAHAQNGQPSADHRFF